MVSNALLLVALVLLILAACSWPNTGRVSLGWLGVAFAVLAALWPAVAASL